MALWLINPALGLCTDTAIKRPQCSYVCYQETVSCSSDGKASACNAGDPGSIPGLGRSPGEGNGNPFFWAPKSLQMVSAAMKLKDAYPLEGKL